MRHSDGVMSPLIARRVANNIAKPAVEDATVSDALLMMNVVMVFLWYCLQK